MSQVQTTKATSEPSGAAVRRFFERYAMLLLLLVLVVLFSVLLPKSFATGGNASTILLENTVLAVLALSVMLPLVVNEFDLSVASVMGFSAMLAAGLSAKQGAPTWLVFVAILAFSLAVGGLHALLIVRFKLPSFIVTLGTNSVLMGAILLYSGGAVIYESVPEAITFIGTHKIFGIGLPVYVLLVLVVVLWFLLEKRPVGRKLYAVGSNEEASRLAGIKTGKVRAWVMISASLIAGLAGLLLTARVGSASPTTFQSFFLPAFAAAFLSLAAYKPGQYNPLGVVTAVYLIGTGISGLSLLGVPSWFESVFHGVALIIAIALSKMLTKGGGRSITPP